jgi:hypothetical protein
MKSAYERSFDPLLDSISVDGNVVELEDLEELKNTHQDNIEPVRISQEIALEKQIVIDETPIRSNFLFTS